MNWFRQRAACVALFENSERREKKIKHRQLGAEEENENEESSNSNSSRQ